MNLHKNPLIIFNENTFIIIGQERIQLMQGTIYNVALPNRMFNFDFTFYGNVINSAKEIYNWIRVCSDAIIKTCDRSVNPIDRNSISQVWRKYNSNESEACL